MSKKILILLGPTASGKSSMIAQLMEARNDIQIINCDSKQIYKDITIITAQPSSEEIEKYNYRLYGYVPIEKNYNVTDWITDALKEIELAERENKIPLLVGGTGFYIKCLIDGLSQLPEIQQNIKDKVQQIIDNQGLNWLYEYLVQNDKRLEDKIQKNDSYRITKAAEVFFQTNKSIFHFYENKISNLDGYEVGTIVMVPDRKELYERINKRFDDMIQNNVILEALQVRESNLDRNLPGCKACGLPELISYLDGEISLETAIEKAKQYTRNYAKRQITWFRHQLKDAKLFNNQEDTLKFLCDC